jgi:acrylyl-CoA reductase (NADPH)
VIPFLLRGVNLLGIDSVMCSTSRRIDAWDRLRSDLSVERLDSLAMAAGLNDVPRLAADILKGQLRGRVVIDVNR